MNTARLRNQTCCYWGAPANDGYGGFSYAEPVELSVRWEDKQEVFTSARGDQDVSRCIVYPGQALDLDGMLYLGGLADLDSSQEGNPSNVDGAFKIKATAKIPNLKGTEFVYKAWL